MEIRDVPGGKHHLRATPQLLRPAHIRAQDGDVARVHLNRDLWQVIMPKHRDQPDIHPGKQSLQIIVGISVGMGQPRELGRKIPQSRHGRTVTAFRRHFEPQSRCHLRRHLFQRLEEEIKSLVAPHIAQIGKGQRTVIAQRKGPGFRLFKGFRFSRPDIRGMGDLRANAMCHTQFPHRVRHA